MKSDKGQEHVRQFIVSVLKDGTPPEVLLKMAHELEQEMKRKR
jgi:regulator of RNase E activity RraB